MNAETGEVTFMGSKTEATLLEFAQDLGWANFESTQKGAHIIQMIPFSSERKAMGVVVKLSDDWYHFCTKGASEILSKRCTNHLVIHQKGGLGSNEVEVTNIDDLARDNISCTIIFCANQTLHTITLCYHDFASWPPTNLKPNEENEIPDKDLSQDMTLIAITSIEDPLLPGVTEAVAKCHHAGVMVKMCTGDDYREGHNVGPQH